METVLPARSTSAVPRWPLPETSSDHLPAPTVAYCVAVPKDASSAMAVPSVVLTSTSFAVVAAWTRRSFALPSPAVADRR